MGTALAIPQTVRTAVGRRAAEVLALAGLQVCAAVMLAIAVAFPFSPGAPVALGVVMLVVALVMAGVTFGLHERIPRAALAAQAAVAAVLNSVLVVEATTAAGAMGDGIAYVWLAAYVAVFFPRIAGRFAAAEAVLYAAALHLADVGVAITGWAVIAVSTWMLAVVLGHVAGSYRRRASTDALTGALNRAGLDEAAGRLLHHARRHDDAVTVAVLDLDGFKQINDRGGHAVGDRVLAGATAAWRATLRDGDLLARVGGDEFVLVLPRTREAEAPALLDRLERAHDVGWSAGVTEWRPGEPLAACVDRADRRLYAAKAA